MSGPALGVIEARLQVGHDLVDHVPAAFLLPPLDRCLTSGDELRLHATPGCSRDDRFLDELGQRLALAQVGIEIELSSLVGKWKTSRNRSSADRDGVVDGLSTLAEGDGDAEAAAMAAAMAAGTTRREQS